LEALRLDHRPINAAIPGSAPTSVSTRTNDAVQATTRLDLKPRSTPIAPTKASNAAAIETTVQAIKTALDRRSEETSEVNW
jgi:hypothetical protein